MVDERRVVLVTGASSGIGWSVAEVLSRRSFRVFGTTRRGLANGIKPAGGLAVIELNMRRGRDPCLRVYRQSSVSSPVTPARACEIEHLLPESRGFPYWLRRVECYVMAAVQGWVWLSIK